MAIKSKIKAELILLEITLSGDMCSLAVDSYFNTFSLEKKVKEIERLKGNFSETDWFKSLEMKGTVLRGVQFIYCSTHKYHCAFFTQTDRFIFFI